MILTHVRLQQLRILNRTVSGSVSLDLDKTGSPGLAFRQLSPISQIGDVLLLRNCAGLASPGNSGCTGNLGLRNVFVAPADMR